ncbi:hypothetical protein V6N12_049584 [Hibiscus sabdariffa]|uniref:Uncharacterized protein n=1 Tax=Hibiscus sabdariffa TaxID=183260 RepID=A0ABR2GA83_9ROSI
MSTSTESFQVKIEECQYIHKMNSDMFKREETSGWRLKWGSFLNECEDDRKVLFRLTDFDTRYMKRGLTIEGIELRPKDICS